MSTNPYPYDPAGTSARNLILAERHTVASYGNKYNCIIPLRAPFYRKDLVLKDQAGRRLQEGVDFYLGHKYLEGTEDTKMPVFGSIMLDTRVGFTVVEFSQYRTIGGDTAVRRDVLIEHLAALDSLDIDPRNLSWEDVRGHMDSIAPIAPWTDLNDAINRDPITNALHRFKLALEGMSAGTDILYRQVLSELNRLDLLITAENVQEHVNNTDSPHDETPAQLGALPSAATAVNAIKAFGRTLPELIRFIQNLGIPAEEVEGYLRNSGGTLKAPLILKDGVATIKSPSGDVSIDLSTGKIKLKGNNGIDLSGTSFKLTGGLGDLYISSAGGEFEGFALISDLNLDAEVPSPDPVKLRVFTSPTAGLTASGVGRNGPALSLAASWPTASISAPGMLTLSRTPASTAGSHAAVAADVTNIESRTANKVPKTRTINGKALSGNITITAADLGLGAVNNTGDNEKPVTDALTNALLGKAVIGHTHSGETVNIPQATAAQLGGSFLRNALSDETNNMIDGKTVGGLSTRLDAVMAKYDDLLDRTAMEVINWAGLSYLPPPITGSYTGSGFGGTEFAGAVEGDGTVVMLRSGADMLLRRVYYSYCERDIYGNYPKYIPTPRIYQPDWLKDGVVEAIILSGCESFVCRVLESNGNTYHALVYTGGTMDQSRHVAARLDPSVGFSREFKLATGNNTIYLVMPQCHVSGLNLRIWVISISEVQTQEVVAWTPALLSGNNIKGERQTNVSTFVFGPGPNRDPNSGTFMVNNATPDWDMSSIRHNGLCAQVGISGTMMRVMIFATAYIPNASTSRWVTYIIRYTVNLVTGEVVLESKLPYTLDENANMDTKGDPRTESEGMILGVANRVCASFFTKGLELAFSTYGTLSPPYFCIKNVNKPENAFVALEVGRDTSVKNNHLAQGAFGSVSGSGFRTQFLGESHYLYTVMTDKNLPLRVKVDPNVPFPGRDGFGPTLDRKVVPANTYREIKGVPAILANNTTVQQGAVVLSPELDFVSEVVNGEPTAKRISISQAVWDQLMTTAAVDTASGPIVRTQMHVLIHPLAKWPCVAYYLTDAFTDDTRTTRRAIYRTMLFTPNVRDGRVTTIRDLRIADRWQHGYNVTSSGGDNRMDGCGSYVSELHDDHVAISNQTMPQLYSVGSGTMPWVELIINPAGEVTSRRWSSGAWWTVSGWIHSIEFGVGAATVDSSGTTIQANTGAFTSAQVISGSYPNPILVHSSEVKSGWIVYVTDDVNFTINFETYVIPASIIDIEALYQTNRSNTVFYLYAEVVNGAGVYKLLRTLEPDSNTRLYLGKITTGPVEITSIDVERVTDIKGVTSVNDHISSTDDHGVSTLLPYDVRGGGLTNLGKLLRFPGTFTEEVMWGKRLSFATNASTFPYRESDLNAWTPSSGNVASNSITGDGYKGMLYQQELGDYSWEVAVKPTGGVSTTAGVILHSYVDNAGVEIYLLAEMLTDEPQKATLAWVGAGTRTEIDSVMGTVVGPHNKPPFTITATRTGYMMQVSFYDYAASGVGALLLNVVLDLRKVGAGPSRIGYAIGGSAGNSMSASFTSKTLTPILNLDGLIVTQAALTNLAKRLSDTFIVVTGKTVNGGTIPTPAGFTPAQCHAIVTANGLSSVIPAGITDHSLDGIDVVVDQATKVVRALYCRESPKTFINADPTYLDYLLIGVK